MNLEVCALELASFCGDNKEDTSVSDAPQTPNPQPRGDCAAALQLHPPSPLSASGPLKC